jgi:hypothetical protein
MLVLLSTAVDGDDDDGGTPTIDRNQKMIGSRPLYGVVFGLFKL